MEDYMENLRKELGNLIRKKIASSELRQIDLARELGITPAAVSQMLSGKITPNIIQLQKLSDKLNCTRSEYSRMQEMLANIKSRGRLGLSYLNYELRRARTEKNWSIAELSRQTGITPNDIKLFENNPCLNPDRGELSALCSALGLDVNSFVPPVEYPDNTPAAVPPVREEPTPYGTRTRIPHLELKLLKSFHPTLSSIDSFVGEYSRQPFSCSGKYFNDKMFAISASCTELPLLKGLDVVLIAVMDYAKAGDIVLVYRAAGGFSLRRYDIRNSQITLDPLTGETPPPEDAHTADFILPVAEISFRTDRMEN